MKTLLCWGTAMLAIVAAVPGDAQSARWKRWTKALLREKLMGSWRLVGYSCQRMAGQNDRPRRDHRIHAGQSHVVPNHAARHGIAVRGSGPVRSEQCDYEAYYGTYAVNEQTHTVTHPVEGAFVGDFDWHEFESRVSVLR